MGSSGADSADSSSPHHALSICDSHSSVGGVLCGPYKILSIAFVFTIVVLLLTEHILTSIERFVSNTPYESVINKVYKEMTCVGCLTFLTVLINIGTSSNGRSIPEEWLHSIEQADFVAFVISVLYIFQVGFHMLMSIVHTKKWKAASALQVDVLLKSFDESEHGGLLRWIPFSKIRDQVEYKIFLCLFCKKFNIRKSEFNFSSYLTESFKRYIISLLDDTFIVRISFGVLIGLNAIRVEFAKAPHSHHDSPCGEECHAVRILWFFCLCGWVLVLVAFVLAFFTRLYQLRLLSCAGVMEAADYRVFLVSEEDIELAKIDKRRKIGKRQSSVTLGKVDLKKTIEDLKAPADDLEMTNSNRWSFKRKKLIKSLSRSVDVARCFRRVTRYRAESDEEEEEEDEDDDAEGKHQEGGDVKEEDDEDGAKDGPSTRSKKKILVSTGRLDDSTSRVLQRKSMLKQMSFATLLNIKGASKQSEDQEGMGTQMAGQAGDGESASAPAAGPIAKRRVGTQRAVNTSVTSTSGTAVIETSEFVLFLHLFDSM